MQSSRGKSGGHSQVPDRPLAARPERRPGGDASVAAGCGGWVSDNAPAEHWLCRMWARGTKIFSAPSERTRVVRSDAGRPLRAHGWLQPCHRPGRPRCRGFQEPRPLPQRRGRSRILSSALAGGTGRRSARRARQQRRRATATVVTAMARPRVLPTAHARLLRQLLRGLRLRLGLGSPGQAELPPLLCASQSGVGPSRGRQPPVEPCARQAERLRFRSTPAAAARAPQLARRRVGRRQLLVLRPSRGGSASSGARPAPRREAAKPSPPTPACGCPPTPQNSCPALWMPLWGAGRRSLERMRLPLCLSSSSSSSNSRRCRLLSLPQAARCLATKTTR